jgi:hypothetical protein
MKRLLLSLACVLAFAVSAPAQSIVIDLELGVTPEVVTLSATQVTVLQAELARFNETTRQGEAPLTLNQWVRALFSRSFAGYFSAFRQQRAAEACAKFQALSAADQKAITDKLEGKSPCAQ